MTEREPALLGDTPGEAKASPGEPARPAKAAREAEPARPAKAAREAEPTRPAKPAPRAGKPAPASTARPGPTVHVAGFWRRVAAGLVDLAIILPVGLVLAWIATALADVHLPPSRIRGLDFWLDLVLASDPALVTGVAMVVVAATIYLLVFQALMGRTVGMRLLRIRVIDVWGDAPSIARCAARTGAYLVSAATLMLGFLWVGFDREKRGLHDWIAGTYVIKA